LGKSGDQRKKFREPRRKVFDGGSLGLQGDTEVAANKKRHGKKSARRTEKKPKRGGEILGGKRILLA